VLEATPPESHSQSRRWANRGSEGISRTGERVSRLPGLSVGTPVGPNPEMFGTREGTKENLPT